MKSSVLLLLLFVTGYAFAQEDISIVRGKSVGSEISITGIVLNGPELGSIRYIQDKTAGIAAYGSAALSGIERGDSVTISGTLKSYNNLLEVDPITNVDKVSSGNELPVPKVITPGQLGEKYEGQLLRMNGVQFVNPGATFQGNKAYTFTNGQQQGAMYISNSYTGIVGEVVPQGGFDLVCICSQFSYSSNDTINGYQVIPRDMGDFIQEKEITLASALQLESLSKTSLDFTWETDKQGSTEMAFGFNGGQDSWDGHVTGYSETSSNGFKHFVSITNLEPSTLVFAQAFSVLGQDTAFSQQKVFVTESASSGDIKVYFNTPVEEELARGQEAAALNNAIDDTLIAYINRATETIDMCIYNINNSGISNISEALNQAKNRGVRVRFITCGTTAHSGVYSLDAGIPRLVGPTDSQRAGIMHNKFVVFDAHSGNDYQPVVCTGSTNYTEGQINTDPNNTLFIQDKSLALGYELEFEEMWGSSDEQPDPQNARFGSQKTDNTPHKYIVGGKNIESYFSPTDGTNQHLIDAINTTDFDLNIATMLLTRSDIAYSISDAKNNGAMVHMLTDHENNNSDLANSVLSTALGANYIFNTSSVPGTMHNKYAIVDQSHPQSDPQVVTGSHNWSNAANNDNDENTLVIHDVDIANQYYQQFAYLFGANGGAIEDAQTAPTAVNDTFTTLQGGFVEVPVLLNDVIEGEIQLTLLENAANGQASVTAGNTKTISYEPNPDFSGLDSFVYQISYLSTPELVANGKVYISAWATGAGVGHHK